MPQISYSGAFNSATLTVPDVYLNVLPPTGGVVRPASVGVLAIRGVASWGPTNVAVPAGSLADLAMFGGPTVRKWDLVTAAMVALQTFLATGGGSGLMLSRATDNTDTAAFVAIGLAAQTAVQHSGAGGSGYTTSDSVTLTNGVVLHVSSVSGGAITGVSITTAAATSQPSNPVAQASTTGSGTGATFDLTYAYKAQLTAKYTGSTGNNLTATISAGSSSTTATPTYKVTIILPGFAPEIFDNLTGSTSAVLWTNIVSAINNGNTPQRGPSNLVVATDGSLNGLPALATSTFSGGTDGTASIVSANLIGSESGNTRKGIYTFRGLGCSDGMIADFDDDTQNATLIAFAQSEGIYFHTNDVAGETISSAQSTKQDDGTDNPWLKIYLGDWVYWNDNVNGLQRLLGPATFGAPLIASLSPQEVGLNKACFGIVGTQRSKSQNVYSSQDLANLEAVGIEVICNPIPRGSMFGLRTGRNSSSDPTRNLDNWPRLTSFIARSLAGPGALGPAIGELITPDFFTTWYAVLDTFLAGLQNATPLPLIQAYQISFSPANNPQAQTAQGLVVAECLIQYLGIAQVFLVNLQTGATVVIPQSSSSFALAA